MNTNKFPYYRLPFLTFNVAQEAVVPFLDQDCNIVICLKTAVGKTALAECAFGYHLTTSDDCKVLYSSPYKSLSREKFDSWNGDEQFSPHGVLLNTGDNTPEPHEYDTSRMIIITAETLDSKTRNPMHKEWLKKVSCVVFDEAHLIGKGDRGANLEAAMMRFSRINPQSRIILLSATLGNGMEVARWIKSLNNKPTKFIESDWRPNDLSISYHEIDDSDGESEQNKIAKAIELASQKRLNEKVIIFVHSKVLGAKLVNALNGKFIRSAFHNASVSSKRKAEIEEQFNDPYSGLDVVVATSTLAAGVNLG
ncbi:MAG: DEAD/DEAH box helicase [Planctomycetota bacterium]